MKRKVSQGILWLFLCYSHEKKCEPRNPMIIFVLQSWKEMWAKEPYDYFCVTVMKRNVSQGILWLFLCYSHEKKCEPRNPMIIFMLQSWKEKWAKESYSYFCVTVVTRNVSQESMALTASTRAAVRTVQAVTASPDVVTAHPDGMASHVTWVSRKLCPLQNFHNSRQTPTTSLEFIHCLASVCSIIKTCFTSIQSC